MSVQAIKPQRSSNISPEEWEVRVALAACYRLVHLSGWTDLVFTHISARVPGTDEHFLLNPFGYAFDEVTASSQESKPRADLNADSASRVSRFRRSQPVFG